MPKRSGILTGTAGVYYVASQLAARDFHAAVTYGNAPSVDILVGRIDGSTSLSLQVNDKCLMIPSKSVSGIFFPTEIWFEACQLCPRERCVGRRAPYAPDLVKRYKEAVL